MDAIRGTAHLSRLHLLRTGARMLIGMPLERALEKGLLDLSGARVTWHSNDLVGVELWLLLLRRSGRFVSFASAGLATGMRAPRVARKGWR